MAPKPNPSTPKPGVSQAKPGVSLAKPGVSQAKPGVSQAKPGASKGKKGAAKGKKGAAKGKKGAAKGKAGKAKKSQPGVQQPKPPDTAEPEDVSKEIETPAPEAPPPEQHRGRLHAAKKAQGWILGKIDIIIIVTLWSLEIIYVIAEALKSSLFYTDFEVLASQRKSSIPAPTAPYKIITLVASIVLLPAIVYLSYGRGKFFYYLVLVCSCLISSAVIGVLAITTNIVFVAGSIIIPQALWPPLCMLRFWLIFHQKFPLSVVLTRIVVTCNVFAIALTEYVVSVWVSVRKFEWLGYMAAWSVVLALMLIHLGLVLVLKPHMNKAKDDVNLVKKVYSDSGLSDSFRARQTTQHIVLFTCLIIPSMVMCMQKAAMTHIFWVLGDELGAFARHRIDLIISLVCLPIVAGLLIMLTRIRQEMQDLLVIGVAHFLNIVFCAFLLALIIIHSGMKDPPFPLPVLRTSVVTNLLFTGSENEGLIVKHENARRYHKPIIGNGLASIYAKIGSTVWVSGKFPNGTVVFDKNITVTRNEGYFVKNKKLWKIKDFGKSYKPMPKPGALTLIVITGMTPCGEGQESNENGTRVRFNGECHSGRLNLSFIDYGLRKKIMPNWIIDVPTLGKVEVLRGINLTGFKDITYGIDYYMDGQLRNEVDEIVTFSVGIHDNFSHTIMIPELGIKDNMEILHTRIFLLPRYDSVELPWPYQWANSISVVLVLSCFAIGVASASYIHFVWIQCPAKHRILMLAIFFEVNFLGAWASDFFLAYVSSEDLSQLHFKFLLVSQVIGGLWHAGATIYFYKKLRKLNDEEKTNPKNVQF